jgi:membrane protein implicated in regulation of membrane protease activity
MVEITSETGGPMWWLLWLAAAVALGVAEALTLTLGLGLLAGAALMAALAAGLGAPLALQVLIFAVTGGVGLVAVRPIAKRHLRLPPLSRDGTDALVGRQAVVTQEVSPTHGLVHLAGEEWSARPYDDELVIPVGSRVDVLQIEGAIALVHPRDPLPPLPERPGPP